MKKALLAGGIYIFLLIILVIVMEYCKDMNKMYLKQEDIVIARAYMEWGIFFFKLWVVIIITSIIVLLQS